MKDSSPPQSPTCIYNGSTRKVVEDATNIERSILSSSNGNPMVTTDMYSGTDSVENVLDQMKDVNDVCEILIRRSCRMRGSPQRFSFRGENYYIPVI